jgi:TP901 family phage tail tape measure protein
MALGTEFIIKYLSDITGATQGAKQLERLNSDIAATIGKQYATAASIIKQNVLSISTTPLKINGNEFLKTTETIQTEFKNIDGTVGRFIKTETDFNGATAKISGSLKDVTTNTNEMSKSLDKSSVSSLGLIGNMAKLALRAALVVPIWQLMRGVMDSTTRIFTDGTKDMLAFDEAMQKLKKTLQGTPEEIETGFKRAEKAITDFSILSGKSNEQVAASITKFTKAGFDIETAMKAGTDAVKLAVITYSDAEIAANTFAHGLRVMVTDIKNAELTQKELSGAMALTAELYKTNSFSIEDLNSALSKFGGTAKTMGLSMGETITLLAALSTRGLEANRAANLLRTSFTKLNGNLDEVAAAFGIKINPAVDRTFDVFMKVITAISQLRSESGKISPDLQKAVGSIFGGARAGEPINALIGDIGNLNDELKKFLSTAPDINNFNKSFTDTTIEASNAVKRIHNINKEIGESFITGLTGAEDFKAALIGLIGILEKVQSNAQDFGDSLHNIFMGGLGIEGFIDSAASASDSIAKIQKQVGLAMRLELDTAGIQRVIDQLFYIKEVGLDIGIPKERIEADIAYLRDFLAWKTSIKSAQDSITSSTNDTLAAENKLKEVVLTNKELKNVENSLRKQLKDVGIAELEIEEKILKFREETKRFTTEELSNQKELVQQLQLVEAIQLNQSRARGLVDIQLDSLRLQGATALQVTQERIELEKIYGIQQDKQSLLNNELDLQKEITKEKLNQNKVSSLSLKLFEIAQTKGTDVARLLAEALSGDLSLTTGGAGTSFQKGGFNFNTGGLDLEGLLQEFFPDFLKQLMAQEFFFKGVGQSIPIPERAAIDNFKPLPITTLEIPKIESTINIDVKTLLNKEEMGKQILEQMKLSLTDPAFIKKFQDALIEPF